MAHAGGRTPKWTSPEELDAQIRAYFKNINDDGILLTEFDWLEPPTICTTGDTIPRKGQI